MDDELKLVLTGVDHASGMFRAAGQNAANAFSGINRAAQSLGGGMDTLRTTSGRATSAIVAGFEQVGAAVKSAATHVGTTLVNALQSAAGMVRNLAVGLGGLAIAAEVGLGAFAKRGVDMNLVINGGTAALTQLLGSADAAKQFMGALGQEAAKSIPTLRDLIPIATQLVQAYGPANLGKVLPTIRAFGDAAAIAAGGDTNRMNQALLGFRQLINKGKPEQEELNQIGENLGVNVNGILSKQFGTADTQVLQKANITGRQVADAIVAGLQAQFGGAQAKAAGTLPGMLSNIDDALNSLAAGGTTRLLEGLTRAAGGVLAMLNRITESGLGQRVLSALLIPFEMVATAVEKLAGNGEIILQWVDQVANADGIRLFALNSIAFIQTLAQSALQFFGVDLKKLTDPKTIDGWFNALGVGVAFAVNTFFGLGRVWKEVGKIAVETWESVGENLENFTADTERAFQAMFLGLEAGFHSMTANAIGSFAAVLDSINTLADSLNGNIVFKWLFMHGQDLPTFDTSQLRKAEAAERSANNVAGIRAGGIADAQGLADRGRAGLEAARDQANPHRHDDPTKRIADAFMGNGRDTGDQDAFWKRFNDNRTAAAKFFFQGVNATAPQFPGLPAGVPPSPSFAGAAGAGRNGVTTVPGVAIPSFPGYGGGAAAGGAYDFSPVTLPDGRVMSRYAAETQGLLPEQAAEPEAAPARGRGGSRRMPGYSPTINITPGLSYEQSRQLIQQEFDRYWKQAHPLD